MAQRSMVVGIDDGRAHNGERDQFLASSIPILPQTYMAENLVDAIVMPSAYLPAQSDIDLGLKQFPNQIHSHVKGYQTQRE